METITSQYLEYINMMQLTNVDIASEFIVTAATLLHIKTKWLLPVQSNEDENDDDFDDPRLDLLQKLLEYKKFKEAGEHLGKLHEDESASWMRIKNTQPEENKVDNNIQHAIYDLYAAFNKLLKKKKFDPHGKIHAEKFSIEQKIQDIRNQLALNKQCSFSQILNESENKEEIVCLFLGILELIRLQEIIVEQTKGLFGEIILKRNQLKLTLEEQN
jgi:segregation and condensation protein A